MIWRIWIKLFLIALLAILPMMAGQYWMQKDSVELVMNVGEKSKATAFMDSHLENLKRLSRLDPAHSEQYHAEFERAVEAKSVGADLELVHKRIVDDILWQTLRNTLLIVALALAATYLIARNIVGFLRRLVRDNQAQSLRLERMGALESWQKIARMMVHELRGPITPLKLIATDIQTKHQNLNPEGFSKYLSKGTELIHAQVTAIERLTDSLTKFAKLPEVQKRPVDITDFLRRFNETYRDYGADLRLEKSTATREVACDTTLMSQLFFNLLKNAVEANPEQKIQARLDCRQDNERTWITFTNSGNTIPSDIAKDMFKLHISTKSRSTGTNFGVGLTIAKKIALDHNGDLYLRDNSATGVAFELEIPNL